MGEGTVVKRWRRFGHDRLYVTVDGDQLGYWDHSAQTLHPRTPEVESDLRQALDRHWASGGPPPKAAVFPEAAEHLAAAEVPVPAAPPAMERPWTDLAASPAGAALRDRAVAAREAAPVKTLLGRLLQVHTDERAWRIGGAGEQAVAARLARLPDSWRVLHPFRWVVGAATSTTSSSGPAGCTRSTRSTIRRPRCGSEGTRSW